MQKRKTPEIIAGRVNADGSIAAGDGFTSQKTATGTYVLSFSSGFRLIITVATLWSPAGIIVAQGTTVLTFTVGAVAQDAIFSFIAVGVQQ